MVMQLNTPLAIVMMLKCQLPSSLVIVVVNFCRIWLAVRLTWSPVGNSFSVDISFSAACCRVSGATSGKRLMSSQSHGMVFAFRSLIVISAWI